MLRNLYRRLLGWHPAAFGQRFSEEMLEFFDSASGAGARLALFADVLQSLGRQWAFRREFRRPASAAGCEDAAKVLLFGTIAPYKPRPTTLFQGLLITLIILGAGSGMAGWGGGEGVALAAGVDYPDQAGRQRAQPEGRGARYEVASIKPSRPTDPRRHGMEYLPGGYFRSTNMPLLPVLATAYNIPFQSIEVLELRMRGVPDWVLSEPYDVEVKAGNGSGFPGMAAGQRNEQMRLMLQAVFADRLKLRIRREIAETPVYGLVAGPHGIKLGRAKIAERDCTEGAPFGGTGCHQFQGGAGRGIRGTAIDMVDLAAYVSSWSDRPVIDQTGIKGLYEIQTEGWTSSGNDDANRPGLAEILDRVGLKLVRKKSPLEIVVIEHLERPSEN